MEKSFLQRFKMELAAGAIGAGAIFGAQYEDGYTHEKPENMLLEHGDNQQELNNQTQEKEHTEEDTASLFSEHQFLLSELFELGADAHETKQLFDEIEGELIDNRFSGSHEAYQRYFAREVGEADYETKKKIIYEAAEKEGISGAMLQALCYVETGCRPLKNKSTKAAGYFQFLAPAAKEYGLVIKGKKDERFDLKKSAEAAAKYLAKLKGRFGQEGLAMVAYSGGQGKLERRLREAFPQVFTDTERKAKISELHTEILQIKKELKKKKRKADRREFVIKLNHLRKELRPLLTAEQEFMNSLPEALSDGKVSLVSYMVDGGYDETGSAEYPIAVQLYAQKFEEAEVNAKNALQIVRQ